MCIRDSFEDVPTKNKTFTPEAKRDLIISLITLKYTQSNSVCYVKDGQAIDVYKRQGLRVLTSSRRASSII